MLAAVLYLMCDDLPKVVKSLRAKKAACSEIGKEPWGDYTTVMLPSGLEIALYQPSHRRRTTSRPDDSPMAFELQCPQDGSARSSEVIPT